ncbi:MAG TPA: VOC family protein [Steroidobacteraceae bacterium]|nr:VOC family protein [Steroidobacteraceae bacterium]
MGQVGFGQPDNGIIQMAYVVEDLDAAMAQWRTSLNVGPWFVLEHFTGEKPLYRGQHSRAAVKLAMGFAGHMNVELIQPKNDEPSVYREVIERRGYGFHHFGVATWEFDAAVAKYERAGHALAFVAAVPSGGRVGYMDTTAVLGGFTELIELGGAFEEVFGRFYRESCAWDGKDPVRSFI